MGKQCKCGKGYISQWDGKCGHCRTKKEQRDHEYALQEMIVPVENLGMAPLEAYKYIRRLCK